jgi:hypothetical protein
MKSEQGWRDRDGHVQGEQEAPRLDPHHRPQGKAVHVEPMKSKLKAPGAKLLKVMYDLLLSSSKSRRYTKEPLPTVTE